MGAILDRITREGLTEEVTYELRLEGNRGVFRVEHFSCANTLKEEYVVCLGKNREVYGWDRTWGE